MEIEIWKTFIKPLWKSDLQEQVIMEIKICKKLYNLCECVT